MAELGNKHECFECGVKFYDLGKSQAICPQCGANQKQAGKAEKVVERKTTRRKKAEKKPAAAASKKEDEPESKPEADGAQEDAGEEAT